MEMRQIYAALLRLYPKDHRTRFAAEMLNVFEKAAEQRGGEGRLALVRFVQSEFIGVMFGAGAAWIAKSTAGSSARGRSLCMSVGQSTLPNELIEAESRVAILISRTVHAIANHDFPGARSYSNEEQAARENLRLLREKYGL
jgi:hypothetical protein